METSPAATATAAAADDNDDDDRKLLHATESVNQLTCTNLNFVDYSKERGGGSSSSDSSGGGLLPVVVENGTTAEELNLPITRLAQQITSTLAIPKNPPYFMTSEAFLNDFNGRFKRQQATDHPEAEAAEEEEEEYYSLDIMLRALVPGQGSLIQNIQKLIRTHDYKPKGWDDLVDLGKLGGGRGGDDGCEAGIVCRGPWFIDYNNVFPPPKLPKLRSPRVYQLTPDLFANREKAIHYLNNLKISLDQEVTTRCLVCDAVNYYENMSFPPPPPSKRQEDQQQQQHQKRKRSFSFLGVPYMHSTFYKNSSNYQVLLDANKDEVFKNVTVHKKEMVAGEDEDEEEQQHLLPTYYLTYQNTIYE